MFEDKKSLEEKKEFFKVYERFLSEFAKVTENPVIKSMDSSSRLMNKINNLIDANKIDSDTYNKNVYIFLEQLNKLTDDFIKENK